MQKIMQVQKERKSKNGANINELRIKEEEEEDEITQSQERPRSQIKEDDDKVLNDKDQKSITVNKKRKLNLRKLLDICDKQKKSFRTPIKI